MLTKKELNKRLRLRKLGLSYSKIAEKCGVTKRAIIASLQVSKNPKGHRKYTLDETYFNKINTEDKAYFLGLMYADGNVSKRKNLFKIGLQEEDKEILNKFAIYLKTNKPISCEPPNKKNKTWKHNYKLTIIGKKITKSLVDLGCVPQKSLILQFPTTEQVPEHLLRHFIRGYFDGDGHISTHLSIVSSKYFIDGLINIIRFHDLEYKIYNCKNEFTKRLVVGKKKSYLKFLSWIYKDATIYMQRKYEKYINFIG
jgi:transcriptional regulator with XRE-family HTH domain